ncbi:MAG: hypothetical protein AB2A00_36970 [Myxococcota bacterium]
MPITPDPQYYCWKCNNQLVFDVKMGYRDTCPHCATDLHSCRNCQLYDPGAHNSCKESTSDYVPDKEKFNFCGFFKLIDGQREGNAQVDKAKAALEALFKKKK